MRIIFYEVSARIRSQLKLVERALQEPGEADTPGRDRMAVTGPRGHSTAYTVYRLQRLRPDLAARVQAGEISAYQALKEAGLRRSKRRWMPY